MKENKKMSGLLVNGSVKTAGVRFYIRNGETIVRSAFSKQPHRNTRKQFEARMKMRHTTALWQRIGPCKPQFDGDKSSYALFASLANRLPAVYLDANMSKASLLMPGIPMSVGTLPEMKVWLDDSEGKPALLTNLAKSDLRRGEVLRLYTLEQYTKSQVPQVNLKVKDLKAKDLTTRDGYIALEGEDFADPMKGWALVRLSGKSCSTQTVVTRCTYYERFTTDEALEAAAESYGGLTKDC